MQHPAQLPRYAAVRIVSALWQCLYVERKADGTTVLNPDKPCSGADLVEHLGELLANYDLIPGELVAICECQLPGHFCCGVPGVLAHLEEGEANRKDVERCDRCQRFSNDAAAVAELEWLGIVAEE